MEGEYLNANTGKLERRGQGKGRTAVEVASTPPAPPRPIRAPAALIAQRHKSLGSIPVESAAAVLEQELQHALNHRVREVLPSKAVAIDLKIVTRDRLDSEIADDIGAGNDILGRLDGTFCFRASLRCEREETSKRLDDARQALQDPKSLAEPDDVLTRWTMESKLLPTVLDDLTKRIEAASDEIQSALAEAGITSDAFVDFMLREAGPGDGNSPRRPQVISLNARGFLA